MRIDAQFNSISYFHALIFAVLAAMFVPDSIAQQRLERRKADSSQSFLESQSRAVTSRWSSSFSLPGPVGDIKAVTADDSSIYVAGHFSTAGGIEVLNIARWDRTTLLWENLGAGIPLLTGEQITQLAVGPDGVLYVAGRFTEAGGLPANGFAEWTGSQWTVPTSSLQDEERSNLQIFDNVLYATGRISVDNESVFGVLRWVDNRWELAADPLGTTIDLEVIGADEFYVSGAFPVGVDSTAGVAHWDGSNWQFMDSWIVWDKRVPPARVRSISTIGDSLLIGGNISEINGVAARGVALWNGTAWQALGDGIDGFDILVAASSTGNLYAHSLGAGGSLHRWDGETWMSFGPEISSGFLLVLNSYQTDIFFGFAGVFGDFMAPPAARLLWHDGTVFRGFGGPSNQGISGTVASLSSDGESIYAGGQFHLAGPSAANNIAKWTGSSWQPLGDGVKGIVYAVEAPNPDTIYVGGNFTIEGGVGAYDIAAWLGDHWERLGPGISGVIGIVRAIAVDGPRVYVGGSFSQISDNTGVVSAQNIAVWEDGRWNALGSGTSSTVSTIAIDSNHDVYAGGDFTFAGGVPATGVAVWKGSAWLPVGRGFNRPVYKLKFCDGTQLAGGNFIEAEGAQGNSIARWDGAQWQPLGAGTGGDVLDIDCGIGDGIFAVGRFLQAGNESAFRIARWDGSGWQGVDGGVFGFFNGYVVNSVASLNSNVFIGGRFEAVGGESHIPSANFAQWLSAVDESSDREDRLEQPLRFDVYPNPVRDRATISYSVEKGGFVSIELYDGLGRLRRTIMRERKGRGDYVQTIDLPELAGGVYFLVLTNAERKGVKAIVFL